MNIKNAKHCTCFNLRKAARAVTQVYDEALKPTGLRATQFSLLGVVAHQGPAGMSELADHLVMDRTTLTRNLKPLMEQGLLKTVAGDDRRYKPIAITKKGQDAFKKAMPYWQKAQNKLANGLGKKNWLDLLGILDETITLTRT